CNSLLTPVLDLEERLVVRSLTSDAEALLVRPEYVDPTVGTRLRIGRARRPPTSASCPARGPTSCRKRAASSALSPGLAGTAAPPGRSRRRAPPGWSCA